MSSSSTCYGVPPVGMLRAPAALKALQVRAGRTVLAEYQDQCLLLCSSPLLQHPEEGPRARKRLNSPSLMLQQGAYTVALTPGLHHPALESGRRLQTQAEPEESQMHTGTI